MVKTIPFFLYPRGESNPYLKFRKLLFYPLNYKGIPKQADAKVTFFMISANNILPFHFTLRNLLRTIEHLFKTDYIWQKK